MHQLRGGLQGSRHAERPLQDRLAQVLLVVPLADITQSLQQIFFPIIRYNLKRKVAELAPVTLAQFTARLEKQKQAVLDESSKSNAGKVGYCVACR